MMIQTDGFWTMIGILVMVIIKLSKKSFSAELLRLYWAQCPFFRFTYVSVQTTFCV
jgi:hypothetical protein